MENLDRRARKTRATLKHIFIDLLKQKELGKISVTELCKIADINRSTFYLHYCDIYALLSDVEKDCLEEIDELIEIISHQEMAPNRVTTMILEYIYSQKEVLQLFIFQMNEHNFWRQIDEKIIQLFKVKTLQSYRLPETMSEDEFDDILLFLASGYYSVYRKWLSQDCREDMETIARRTTMISQICFEKLLCSKN